MVISCCFQLVKQAQIKMDPTQIFFVLMLHVRVPPYMTYKGTCCWPGYGFWPLCSEQGI